MVLRPLRYCKNRRDSGLLPAEWRQLAGEPQPDEYAVNVQNERDARQIVEDMDAEADSLAQECRHDERFNAQSWVVILRNAALKLRESYR